LGELPVFQVIENAETLIHCMAERRKRGEHLLYEFVDMPNHLHLLLTPGRDTSLEKAMQLIKGGSSHQIHLRRQIKYGFGILVSTKLRFEAWKILK
jgi:REP element-mobilizing transposase RayT